MLRLLKAWLPVILWTALILSFANDEFSEANTRGWLDAPKVVNTIVRKGGHITGYAVLALLAWRARRSLPVALLVALVVSMTDETMQAMTRTREGSLFDVVLDTCAALLALICIPAVRARLSK